MKYDSLILDIDGTIWDTTSIVAQAWNLAVKTTGTKSRIITPELLQKEFGKPMNVIATDLWPKLKEDERKILLEACCKNEQKAIDENQKDITYKNVIPTIKELASKTKIFVVSNCHDGYIQLMLRKTGLANCVQDFECFGKTGLQKDENIRLICMRNNLTSPVYVGDTQGDCDACKKADIPFIWAAYGFGNPSSYVQKLDSFDQLIPLF